MKPLKLRLALLLVSFYIITGNIPRFITIEGFRDNLLITEALIYVTIIFYAVLSRDFLTVFIRTSLIYIIIFLSFIYGFILNGFDVKAYMYSIRLGLMIFSGILAGVLLYRRYKDNFIEGLKFILNTYLILVSLGYLIYLIFPQSAEFWSFLKRYGIEFQGDPHRHRFVSTYFDPNFFAVIAGIPFLICVHLLSVLREKKYVVYLLLIIGSIFLTGSRSGVVAFLILVSALFLKDLMKKPFVSKYSVKIFAVLVFLTLVISPIYWDNLKKMFGRLWNMSTDPSAMHRLESFLFGLEFILDRPLMGLGYNYLAVHMGDAGLRLNSVDSSVLSLLINFGLIFTCLLIVMFFVWANVTYRRHKDDAVKQKLFTSFIIYIAITVAFSSNFNNVLFYQFWLFPCVMIGSYLTKYRGVGPS
ncbi:O-antigen ligase family protein [Paenibacillaceae bacterium WGS1546]|uniref:O-antigen ligase family protein n=1 Tax=Cohnella sp. WGS1546 TaxID=3366810 RepID=UPI00372D4913